MYGIDGRREIPEQLLDHLEGYRGSAPVRIGNDAATQLQLDIYGELVDSIYLYDKYGTPISHRSWDDLTHMVKWVCENWDQADEGIWETRGGANSSRIRDCCAGSRSSARCGWPPPAVCPTDRRPPRSGPGSDLPTDPWRGLDENREAFVQHYDTDVLDASVLLMPLMKFIAPQDPRWLSTLDAIGSELVSDSLVYRYNAEASPDGLAGREGTFSICTFWYVEALARAGRLDRGPADLREDAHLRQPSRPLRRRDRADRRAARQLPPGVHPPRADQRRRQPRPSTRMNTVFHSRRRLSHHRSAEVAGER